MQKYWLIIIISLTLLGSCNENKPDFPYEVFQDSVLVAPSKIIDLGEHNVLNAGEMVIYKGWYFFLESRVHQNCLKAISPDFVKTIETLNVGNGPCDVSEFTRLYVNNDSLFVFDPNLKKVLSVDVVNDSIVVKPYHTFNGRSSKLVPISKCNYVSFDLLDSSFFQVADLDNHVVFKHPYPQDDVLCDMESFSLNTIYGNTYFTVSPSCDKIAFGVANTGMYGFGRIISQQSIQFDKIINYYSIKIGRIADECIVPHKCNIRNILGAASSDDYVFFLHSGDEYQNLTKSIFSHRILMYTWDGNPYKILYFKENPNMIDLHYDAERNVLYGIGCTPEGQYVEINLNGII